MGRKTPVTQDDAAMISRIESLLPSIYAAATNPSLWPGVFGEIVCLLDGSSGLIFSHQATPAQQGIWVPYQCSEEGLRSYAEHYYKFDIWMQRGHELGFFVPGKVSTGDDLLPRKKFLASVFYREFLSKHDIYDLCFGILHDGSDPDIPVVHVAIYRPFGAPVFGEAEKSLLRVLVPHMQEATRIGFRLGAAEQRSRVISAIAETIVPPLILFNSQNRVLFANDTAQTLLDSSKMLRIEAGRLVVDGGHQAKLDSLLSNTCVDEEMLGIPHPSKIHKLWLIRVPVPQENDAPPDARRPASALLLHDPAKAETIDFDSFAKANGLSRAEMRLAGLLLEHGQLPPIAEELGLSMHTLRTQLRTIREKTCVQRQAELVKMLMSWPRKIK